MAQKYYTMQETADLLGIAPAEVKAMIDRRELFGYRDGSDWKFKVEDIDRVVADRKSGDVGDSSDDVLLSEAELGQSGPGSSGTVIGMDSLKPDESDLHIGALPKSSEQAALDSKVAQFEELDLALEEDLTLQDSSISPAQAVEAPRAAGDSAIDVAKGGSGLNAATGSKVLDDDDMVLGGSGAGSDITLGGDSGISLVDAADSGLSLERPLEGLGGDDSLELGEDDMLTIASDSAVGSKEMKTDDEFLLTPLDEAADSDDSESGSQVIALEDGAVTEAPTVIARGPSLAHMLGEDDSAGGAEMPLGAAMGPMPGGLPGGLAGGLPGEELPVGPMGRPDVVGAYSLPEAPYSGGNIAFLSTCIVMLCLCGMFMYDLLRNMWTWDSAMGLNTSLMDTILKWFE